MKYKPISVMNYTTIEQSKKLVELGLSTESADMYYSPVDKIGTSYQPFPHFNKILQDELPCWSLEALLKMMPMPIEYQGAFCYPVLNLSAHAICYMVGGASYLTIGGMSNLEAAYKMVVWLLENDYIKKEK